MKNFLLAFCALLCAQILHAQATRMVLYEEFTQASCGPCASFNPSFDALLDQPANLTKAVRLKYQTSWPGYDPMNEHNPTEVQTRVDYYDVGGVPNVYVNGGEMPGSSLTQSAINTAQAVTSPIEITLTHAFSPNFDKVSFYCTVKNVSSAPFGGPGTRLHVALVEEEVNFATAPGTNGEKKFHNVMKKMYPNAGGTDMTAALAPGESFSYNVADITYPNYVYSLGEIAFVAFVQNQTSKAVHNAAYSTPIAITTLPDVSVTASTVLPTNVCSGTFTPKMKLTNANALVVTNATCNLWVNGAIVATQDWTGNLAQTQFADITFPEYTPTGSGVFKIGYSVSNLNGGLADFNPSNNSPALATMVVVSPTAVLTAVNEGMESVETGQVPANSFYTGDNGAIADYSDKNFFVMDQPSLGISAITGPVGGFAASDKAILVPFYSMTAGKLGRLMYDKINLSAMNMPTLKFDHAYCQYASENDRLVVEISTNCGVTWTSLFNKAGTALKTADAQTAFFAPQTAAQWLTNTISLAPYASSTEAIIRFRATSAYGNNLWLDNINVEGSSSVSSPEEVGYTLNPNPASDLVNIAYATEADQIQVVDVTGRSVATHNLDLGGTNTTLQVGSLSNGVYFCQLMNKNKIISVQKMMVVR